MTIGSCRTTLFVSTRLCNKVKIKSDSSQISMAECKGYHATRIYRNHLNQEIRLNIDEDVFDKYYRSEMTVQKNITAFSCKDGEVSTVSGISDGKLWSHNNTASLDLERVAFSLILEEISIKATESEATDDLGREIPYKCVEVGKCIIRNIPYFLIKENKYPCFIGKMVESNFIQAEGEGDWRSAELQMQVKVVNKQTKTCKGLEYKATQYPGLFVLNLNDSKEHPDMPMIEDIDNNDQLYALMSLDYKYLVLGDRITKSTRENTEKFCKISNGLIKTGQMSTFHENRMERVQGDLLIQEECLPVLLEVREYEVRQEGCYTDALPAYLRNEPVYIRGMHHLVTTEPGFNQINCNAKFLPSYVDIENAYVIQSSPGITIKRLEQVVHPSSQEDSDDVREATDAPSVPYDKKDMETFSQINKLERIKNRGFDHARTKILVRAVMHAVSRTLTTALPLISAT